MILLVFSGWRMPTLSKNTPLEKFWIILVVFSAVLLAISGGLCCFNSLGFMCWPLFGCVFIGAFVMNVLMMVLCCSKLNNPL